MNIRTAVKKIHEIIENIDQLPESYPDAEAMLRDQALSEIHELTYEFKDDHISERIAKRTTADLLLTFLKEHTGKPLKRETIFKAVWGHKNIAFNSRTVDLHISKLRAKGYEITTIHGIGYCLENKEVA